MSQRVDPETDERLANVDAMLALQIMLDHGWMNEAMYARGLAYIDRCRANIPVFKDGLRVGETPQTAVRISPPVSEKPG